MVVDPHPPRERFIPTNVGVRHMNFVSAFRSVLGKILD